MNADRVPWAAGRVAEVGGKSVPPVDGVVVRQRTYRLSMIVDQAGVRAAAR